MSISGVLGGEAVCILLLWVALEQEGAREAAGLMCGGTAVGLLLNRGTGRH